MFQVSDEAIGGTRREGQGVSPKVPLEGHDERRPNTSPDERESGLATSQTRIEETKTRDHDQHHRRSDDDVTLVTLGVPLIEILGGCGRQRGDVEQRERETNQSHHQSRG